MTRKRVAAIFAAALAVAVVGTAGASLMHRMTAPPTATQVTVHGQWTIIVRNKHHKIVARRHFENALTTGGAGLLARLLSRSSAAGSWGVNIGFGAIVDSTNTASDSPPFYKNLTVTAPTSGPDANKVVLSRHGDAVLGHDDQQRGHVSGRVHRAARRPAAPVPRARSSRTRPSTA